MQPARRQHVYLGITVALAIRMHSHDWLCFALFGVLLLVFIYGRVELPRRRRLSDQH